MPASPQYSSVRRGIEHAAEIDVSGRAAGGDDDRLARADIERGAVVAHLRCRARGPRAAARGRCRHAVLEQEFDARLAGRGVERTHQAVAVRRGGAHRGVGGLPVCTCGQSPARQCICARHRIAVRAAGAAVRLLVDELDAVRDQKLEGLRAIVGKGADDLVVVIAIVRGAVGLHNRPVGQVLEHEVGLVVDAVLLLNAGAAAERDVGAAADRVAADVVCASTTITDEPASRATIAAGMPVAPEPMTTTSASRCQLRGRCGAWASAGAGEGRWPVATAAPVTAAVLSRSRREILLFGAMSRRGDYTSHKSQGTKHKSQGHK